MRDDFSNLQKELPAVIMTSEVGSFAQNTILYRKPKIIEKVISENNYPSNILNRLILDLETFASPFNSIIELIIFSAV